MDGWDACGQAGHHATNLVLQAQQLRVDAGLHVTDACRGLLQCGHFAAEALHRRVLCFAGHLSCQLILAIQLLL